MNGIRTVVGILMIFIMLSACAKSEGSCVGSLAVIRYEEFLKDRNNWLDSDHDTLRYAYGFIDDDDIPELFVALDTISVHGVHIYKYDAEKDSVIYLGEFSQYGFCKYSEKKNRIWGQYGNNGYFEYYYFEIAGNEVRVVGRLLVDSAHEEMKYYADYADTTKIFKQMTYVEPAPRPDESHCISEEEYEQKKEEYMLSEETIEIGYDNMTELVLP